MRLITWNCRVGGFRRKAKAVANLRPDVLAVQEVERFGDDVSFSGDVQPTFRDRTTYPDYPSRGIGLFSYTDTQIATVDGTDPTHGFRRYAARRGPCEFQVVAVWTVGTGRKKTSYQQAHDGLRRHADWIKQRPTVLLGDFNANASFKSGDWTGLRALLTSLDLVSAYHHHLSEEHGLERQPTHFHLGKESSPFHLDYCFVPRVWADRITKVQVGRYDDWHTLSDHVPLIVDLDV